MSLYGVMYTGSIHVRKETGIQTGRKVYRFYCSFTPIILAP